MPSPSVPTHPRFVARRRNSASLSLSTSDGRALRSTSSSRTLQAASTTSSLVNATVLRLLDIIHLYSKAYQTRCVQSRSHWPLTLFLASPALERPKRYRSTLRLLARPPTARGEDGTKARLDARRPILFLGGRRAHHRRKRGFGMEVAR